jgi:hypothetical protein
MHYKFITLCQALVHAGWHMFFLYLRSQPSHFLPPQAEHFRPRPRDPHLNPPILTFNTRGYLFPLPLQHDLLPRNLRLRQLIEPPSKPLRKPSNFSCVTSASVITLRSIASSRASRTSCVANGCVYTPAGALPGAAEVLDWMG